MKKPKQLYIIKKYVMANSALHAIKLDKKTPVQDVWIDEDWKKNNIHLTPAIGFEVDNFDTQKDCK